MALNYCRPANVRTVAIVYVGCDLGSAGLLYRKWKAFQQQFKDNLQPSCALFGGQAGFSPAKMNWMELSSYAIVTILHFCTHMCFKIRTICLLSFFPISSCSIFGQFLLLQEYSPFHLCARQQYIVLCLTFLSGKLRLPKPIGVIDHAPMMNWFLNEVLKNGDWRAHVLRERSKG